MNNRVLDALRGMVGFVQLVKERYPDFPVDNHRVIEAMSAINEAETTARAELDASDAKDAARYRWLRNGGNENYFVLHTGKNVHSCIVESSLDAAIDSYLPHSKP